jgi:hypothetical protein
MRPRFYHIHPNVLNKVSLFITSILVKAKKRGGRLTAPLARVREFED